MIYFNLSLLPGPVEQTSKMKGKASESRTRKQEEHDNSR